MLLDVDTQMDGPNSGMHERGIGRAASQGHSSRGWRHQQLIYLPHIINCILFMRSSPRLTSHSTHPSSPPLLPLFCSSLKTWYFCSAWIEYSAVEGWQMEGPRGGMEEHIQARNCSFRAEWHPWRRVVHWRCYVKVLHGGTTWRYLPMGCYYWW